MSFGFSISDITLLIKGLVTVADLIKGDAAHEFQSLSGLFHQYASFAHRLQDCYETGYLFGFAKESLDRMNSTLHRFFARFEYLDPYLEVQFVL
ncbi:hypothetical protein PG993_009282 [Apiospora rasikravindrae]|uniref:Uncharacterized protein n=1 Tax=Apiospora rasikravindrae TaxID=990691 RepID=A0ABR1SIZ7_9PEZI